MNRECEKFKLNGLTPDLSKCLIFVQGFTVNKHTEIISKTLAKLEKDPKFTPQKIAEKCQYIVNIKLDTTRMEERDISHVRPFKKKIL